jgi:hypothetical protein
MKKTFEGKITDNYREYLKEPIRIGFTNSFRVKEILDSREFMYKFQGEFYEYETHLVNLEFGDKEKFTVKGIVTDIVDIAKKLPMGGWGSHCYIQEAKIMEEAIVKMCLENDLMICNKVCSWPYAKAVVQPNHFIH